MLEMLAVFSSELVSTVSAKRGLDVESHSFWAMGVSVEVVMRTSVGRSIKMGSAILGLVIAVCAGSVHAGSVSYTYDTLGRLTQVSYSNGTAITYSYDAAGNRSTVVVSGAP